MVKLNLGSGQHADLVRFCPGEWINVDRNNFPEWPQPPDLIANVLDGLPFADNHFDGAYLGHFLEHLEYDQEVPFALAEVRRVCRPGAAVMTVGPCTVKAQALKCDPAWIKFIGHAHTAGRPGEAHRWNPTTEATVAAIRAHLDPSAVQIPVVDVHPPEWPNSDWWDSWQCAVTATIPPAPA
jgi:SAM-dependent methyltransferase